MKARKVVGSLELGDILGQGGFGRVLLAFDIELKQQVAVKIIDKDVIKANNLQSYVEREIQMMRKIKHKHVVRLLKVLDTTSAYYLVMELAPNGELFDKIVESQRFDESTARKYFQQLISAVHYCHENDIVHRDLKAENLLLGENGELKVCDFGLSRYAHMEAFQDHPVMFTSLAGSTDYQAPEVIKETGYHGFTCDIWSCGVILFFMLCGYLPFAAKTEEETRKRILECSYNKNSRSLSEEAKSIISVMLVGDPTKRGDVGDVVRHPWFQKDLDPALFPELEAFSPILTPSTNGGGRSFRAETNSPFPSDPAIAEQKLQEQEALHQAFVGCNVDGSGFLTPIQVRDVLIKLNQGRRVPEDEITTFMNHFEMDKEQRITEEQFTIGWMKNRGKIEEKYHLPQLINIFHYDLEKELLRDLRKAFDTIDIDKSGVLCAMNFKQLNLGLTDSQVDELIEVLSAQQGKASSTVTFEQFVKACTQKDFLNRHPIAVRLRRVQEMFDVVEAQGYRNFLNVGFMVAGLRETITHKLLSEAHAKIFTSFEPGESEGFLYGVCMSEEIKIHIGVKLMPGPTGYTKMMSYRIAGKTEAFHNWFRSFRGFLMDEINQCIEATAPKGEPELF